MIFRKLAIPTLIILNSGCASGPKGLPSIADETFQSTDRSLASAGDSTSFNMAHALQNAGIPLSIESLKWLSKWKDINLEDEAQFKFKELSGSTSINLKVTQVNSSDPTDTESLGSFVPRNGAANPNTEIAYFYLAAVLGWDSLFRTAIRYELGPKAATEFKALINKTPIRGTQRLENKKRILAAIATGQPLKGCLKAKKADSAIALDEIANTGAAPNGAPKSSHPIIAYLQAGNPKPRKGDRLKLKSGYEGDAENLARQYSVIMTFDALFQQWDRYSGGNVGIQKDALGNAQFMMTDNGGADISKTTSWVERNLSWFSRYDRNLIQDLKEIRDFLVDPSRGYLGYIDRRAFIVDLGLYFELPADVYAERLVRNINQILARVEAVEKRYGNAAYFD